MEIAAHAALMAAALQAEAESKLRAAAVTAEGSGPESLAPTAWALLAVHPNLKPWAPVSISIVQTKQSPSSKSLQLPGTQRRFRGHC